MKATLLFGVCAAWLAFASAAVAQAPLDPARSAALAEQAAALRTRLRTVSEAEGAQLARNALDHARRALSAAERANRDRDLDAAERALSIVDAALILADRLAARERARNALAQARDRDRGAHQRNAAAREALERALVERARVLSQLGPAPTEGDGE